MSKPEDSDPKVRFKEALEKKNTNSKNPNDLNGTKDNSKLRASTGKKPKMFRRKSG